MTRDYFKFFCIFDSMIRVDLNQKLGPERGADLQLDKSSRLIAMSTNNGIIHAFSIDGKGERGLGLFYWVTIL